MPTNRHYLACLYEIFLWKRLFLISTYIHVRSNVTSPECSFHCTLSGQISDIDIAHKHVRFSISTTIISRTHSFTITLFLSFSLSVSLSLFLLSVVLHAIPTQGPLTTTTLPPTKSVLALAVALAVALAAITATYTLHPTSTFTIDTIIIIIIFFAPYF